MIDWLRATQPMLWLTSREEGQGMVEYGLIIALVAIVAIAGLVTMGPKISAMFTALGSSV